MSGAGLTYRDMYLGRQNLPEAWWMPAHWETETTEIVLEDLDRVRLVLSYRGLSLLSNSYEPFFLCVQVRWFTYHVRSLMQLFSRVCVGDVSRVS